MKEVFKVLFTYEQDSETGDIKTLSREVVDEKKPATTTTKRTKKSQDTDPVPKISLEDNKLILNNAAIALMKVQPDDRVEVKYEKVGNKFIPIIGNQVAFGTSGGNRVTKGMTISYRGKSHDRLKEYGTVFELTPHKEKSNIFVMSGNETPKEEEQVVDKEEEINVDDLLDVDEKDAETSISAFDFNNI